MMMMMMMMMMRVMVLMRLMMMMLMLMVMMVVRMTTMMAMMTTPSVSAETPFGPSTRALRKQWGEHLPASLLPPPRIPPVPSPCLTISEFASVSCFKLHVQIAAPLGGSNQSPPLLLSLPMAPRKPSFDQLRALLV
eukprot:3431044-Pyramimonas_sp.AAC.1